MCYSALGPHNPTPRDATLLCVGRRLQVAGEKASCFLYLWDSRPHFQGSMSEAAQLLSGNSTRVITWNLSCLRPQTSPWEAMQRKPACPELCIQILQIIPVREVGVSCKGPDCAPHPHPHGKWKGTVESFPGLCEAGQGMQEEAW